MFDIETETLESFLLQPPFSLNQAEKAASFLYWMQHAYRHHFTHCAAYRKFAERRGCHAETVFHTLSDFPYLPVSTFKIHGELLSSVPSDAIKLSLQSSATSGVASRVMIDKITARRQVLALSSILKLILGPKRLAFFVLDSDPSHHTSLAMGARGAAIRGFLNFARSARYFLSERDAQLLLEEALLRDALQDALATNEPLVMVGFTYVLYEHVVKPLLRSGYRVTLPSGSKVIHIGGWKKLEDKKVSKAIFNQEVATLFGLSETDIIDIYGFTEQMGVIYPDSPAQEKCTPIFSEIIVRDPLSFAPLPDGEVGLMEFLTPLPHSYPGIAVLTDDLGVVVGRGEKDGWCGTHFKMLGRAKKAEIRGCGDVMSAKMTTTTRAPVALAMPAQQASEVRLLLDGGACHVKEQLESVLVLSDLPVVSDVPALVGRVKEAALKLATYSVDELIMLIHAAAERWVAPTSSLLPLRQQGLLFLYQWCETTKLRQIADESLNGRRGFLDGFLSDTRFRKRSLRATARGVAVHWLSGNVPLLGMLAIVQCILTRNANIIKVSSHFSVVMPLLLNAFRHLEVRTCYGKRLLGDDILASIAVLYFNHEDQAAPLLSSMADVRVAWGGKDAVSTIVNLPKKPGAEDIIFGPKLSYMCIGNELLGEERVARKIAKRAAVDASVFDQYACASPHTIFVERGGVIAPNQFSAMLAEEMAKVALRIPKALIDAGTASQVLNARVQHELTGSLWQSPDLTWTVCYDEHTPGLASPVYSRVITIKPIDDIFVAAGYAHTGIQTIGLALSEARKQYFAERALCLGAERFPEIGRMTYFDSPWDGLYIIHRAVRWVTLGGPF